VSSLIAATADAHNASFSIAGYLWMGVNCLVSAAFVVMMRYTMRQMANERGPFRDFDTVFYNNLLTFPMFLLMSLLGMDGHLADFWVYYSDPVNQQEWRRWMGSMLLSGLAAFWISYSSSWCMRCVLQ
jgi:GDP-mannose transporter